MSEKPNNQNPIKGVIFDKIVREVPDTKNKNGGNPYYFTTIVLETDHPQRKGKTFPMFELGARAGNAEDFNIGDPIELTYFLERDEQTWTDKRTGEKVTKFVSKNKGLYIKHADIDAREKNVGNKTAKEIRREAKAEKDLAIPMMDDDDNEQLPF
jgi:hypothetical protein